MCYVVAAVVSWGSSKVVLSRPRRRELQRAVLPDQSWVGMSGAAGAVCAGAFALDDWSGSGPVPDDDFEEVDGERVFVPLAEEEEVAADWFGDEGDAHWPASTESTLPLRSPPTAFPLASRVESVVRQHHAENSREATPLPKRRRLSTKRSVLGNRSPAKKSPKTALQPSLQALMDEWLQMPYSYRRARWVSAWAFLAASAVMSGAATFVEKKARAILEWQKLDDNGRTKFYEDAVRAGWSSKPKGRPTGHQNAKRKAEEPKCVSGMGFLLTRHQEPPEYDSAFGRLLSALRQVDVDGAEYQRLMTELRSLDSARKRWQEFQRFLTDTLERAAVVSEVSCCMEACLNGVEPVVPFSRNDIQSQA